MEINIHIVHEGTPEDLASALRWLAGYFHDFPEVESTDYGVRTFAVGSEEAKAQPTWKGALPTWRLTSDEGFSMFTEWYWPTHGEAAEWWSEEAYAGYVSSEVLADELVWPDDEVTK
jgi:hypothetical protein